jgi:4-hydroxy-3-polyprenylbenzoate decarboxylase
MAYRGLDEFLIRLEQANELIHIDATTHPAEVIQVTRSHLTHGENKALWFDHVAGSRFPIVTNIFGNERRMAWALGVETLQELTDNLTQLVAIEPPFTFGAMMSRAGSLMTALRSAGISTGKSRDKPVQAVQHVDNPTLDILPAVQYFAGDSHPSIPQVQIIIADPETDRQTVRLARAVVLDSTHLAVEVPADAAHHPCAVVIGGDPANMWCADAPLPAGITPYWLAGWVRRRPVPFVNAITQSMRVPADAEFVIEGQLDASRPVDTICFGTANGYYVDHIPFQVMEISAITHREDAVFPLMLPLPEASESHWLNKATERLFKPVLQVMLDEVIEINQPCEARLSVISCQQHYAGQSRKVIHGVWGLGKLAFSRAIVVVDEATDPHDLNAVVQAIRLNVDPVRDIIISDGPVHPHDDVHGDGLVGRIALDATGFAQAKTPTSDEILPNGGRLWNNVVLFLPKTEDHIPDTLSHAYHLVLLPAGFDVTNWYGIICHTLSTVDWRRDVIQHMNPAGQLRYQVDATGTRIPITHLQEVRQL